MFSYVDGYEIDGSSTAYQLVMPKRTMMIEVINYFLKLEVISRTEVIQVTYQQKGTSHNKQKEKTINREQVEKLFEMMQDPLISYMSVGVQCVHPDKLHHKVKEELYCLTAKRPGAEGVKYNFTQPTVSCFGWGPDFYITLEINFEAHPAKVTYEPEGLIFNIDSIKENCSTPYWAVQLICGPSFVYEYAAYIMGHLAERFPELGIDGGIDCAGGFVEGCTYACSLYDLERIPFENTAIHTALEKLLISGLIKPQKRVGDYGTEHIACEQLTLYNLYNYAETWQMEITDCQTKIIKGIVGNQIAYTPEAYEAFAKKVYSVSSFDDIDCMHYCTCMVLIQGEWCAVTCIKQNDEVILELRVEPELRKKVEEMIRKLQ